MSHIDGETTANDLVDFCVNRTLEVDLVLLVTLIDTFVTIITHAEVIVHLVAAAVQREEVVLAAAVLGNKTWPVVCLVVLDHLNHTKWRCKVSNVSLEQSLANTARATAWHVERVLCALGTCIVEELGEAEVSKLLSVHEVRHTSHL